jgi:DNA-binding HxlR family transcriptional regulator
MSEQRPWDLEREILDLIADKWAMLIVNCLGRGTMRFTQLEAEVAGISHKMLAQTLRGLERNGIVERYAHATVPPRVDYNPDPAGRGAPGSSHPDMRLDPAQPRGHPEGTHRLRTRPKLNHAGAADRDDSGLKALASLLAEKPSLEVT